MCKNEQAVYAKTRDTITYWTPELNGKFRRYNVQKPLDISTLFYCTPNIVAEPFDMSLMQRSIALALSIYAHSSPHTSDEVKDTFGTALGKYARSCYGNIDDVKDRQKAEVLVNHLLRANGYEDFCHKIQMLCLRIIDTDVNLDIPKLASMLYAYSLDSKAVLQKIVLDFGGNYYKKDKEENEE